MLHRLVARSRDKSKIAVVSLRANGHVRTMLEEDGVRVVEMGFHQHIEGLAQYRKLKQCLSALKPDLIQTWLYHADLLGGLVGRSLGVPVVWNIRLAEYWTQRKLATKLIIRLCARLSRSVPAGIIFCARQAKATHEKLGYRCSHQAVIPNGIDLKKFHRSEAVRIRARKEMGIRDEEVVVGNFGRYHPQKNQELFLQMAAKIRSTHPAVRFLMAGTGVTAEQPRLRELATGLGNSVQFLGQRHDIESLYQALDIYVSTSLGEGWPNTVAEAMACGVPCVVSNAGDSADVVGNTGIVVPDGTVTRFAAECERLIDAGAERRAQLGALAAARIRDHYSMERVAGLYDDFYQEILAG